MHSPDASISSIRGSEGRDRREEGLISPMPLASRVEGGKEEQVSGSRDKQGYDNKGSFSGRVR